MKRNHNKKRNED